MIPASLPGSLAVRWSRPDGAVIANYIVMWSLNGNMLGLHVVPSTPEGDTNGYLRFFALDNPSVTLVPGDVVGASVQTEDGIGQKSAWTDATPHTVPEPTPNPPPPPVNVSLEMVV